jgi:hypothetical protein
MPWFTEEAVAAWGAPATGECGGQPIYSATAIETGLALRLVLRQPQRQTEGLPRSIANALELDIAIPDHTTLSRRGGGLTILPKTIDREEPLRLLIDSTGLRIRRGRMAGSETRSPLASTLAQAASRG